MNPHQFIAGNQKLDLINHSIIINLRNMPGTHYYVPQRLNRGNGHVFNDHLQGKNSNVSRALDMFNVTSSPRNEIKSKLYPVGCSTSRLVFYCYLLQAPVVVFTNLFQSIRVTKHANQHYQRLL